MNEALTERIVRDNFRNLPEGVTLYEKTTSNPRINQLLRNASKRGDGPGYPDFLVSDRRHDFLIVVECKSDPNQHVSDLLDRYSDYAVDGALLYGSYLSRNFDVISIGVSGTNLARARVSHHLHIKQGDSPEPCFGHKLLPFEDYLTAYLQHPTKLRQDFDALIEFVRDLNERLHLAKVSEGNRALFLSMLLIALDRESFKNAYRSETPARVAQMAIDAALDQLQDAEIADNRIKILKQNFGFVTVATKLLSVEGNLVGIIRDIDEHVKGYVQSNQYRDILGRLYIEFLRYANSDKGLGIVLTPPHIADLFAELAEVHSGSIVYDNCAGTGGFLIHAMGKMVEDAKGDAEKIRKIKGDQLFGMELQSSIYCLAVSNMYIHQDGKSNVFSGDCFDNEIMAMISQKYPTAGLLNPPYKSNKSTDTDELDFVLNNLACLREGGKCVAIVPMQCALSTSKTVMRLKRQLLNSHTLEAVFSMPDELFSNSKVNVVTCVMVFTAHRPHPARKEVYLGYCKDDGFTKTKVTGRADNQGRWAQIKNMWVDNYQNRRPVPGASVLNVLTSDDEWCAEAYMDANYSMLGRGRFTDTVKRYVAYKLLDDNMNRNGYMNLISEPMSPNEVDLNAVTWKRYTLGEVFDIQLGTSIHKKELVEGHFPYITRTGLNNGVSGYGNAPPEKQNALNTGHAITIGAEGYVAFYQPMDFLTGNKISVLKRADLSVYSALFACCVINLVMDGRYNYGYAAVKGRLLKLGVMFPATSDGEVDWFFMETYVKSLPYSTAL